MAPMQENIAEVSATARRWWVLAVMSVGVLIVLGIIYVSNNAEVGGGDHISIEMLGSAPDDVDPYEWLPYDEQVLDPWVRVLTACGIETFESCQATPGHMGGKPDKYPWIRFHGTVGAGYKAVGIALELGWPIVGLSREWSVMDCTLEHPYWKIHFRPFSKSRS